MTLNSENRIAELQKELIATKNRLKELITNHNMNIEVLEELKQVGQDADPKTALDYLIKREILTRKLNKTRDSIRNKTALMKELDIRIRRISTDTAMNNWLSQDSLTQTLAKTFDKLNDRVAKEESTLSHIALDDSEELENTAFAQKRARSKRYDWMAARGKP
jgi:hypothetical protein